MEEQQYISIDDAANTLKVTKATLYYYIRAMKFQTQKFPFDRKAYLTVADFEKIKVLKDQVAKRESSSSSPSTGKQEGDLDDVA